MSEHEQHEPETVTVTTTVVAFSLMSILSLVGMFLILIYNHNGGF
ncbi:hypothetical protein [Patulibacter defluvii]|nr:hypothetical protein [Patulibacter sp. DM4]